MPHFEMEMSAHARKLAVGGVPDLCDFLSFGDEISSTDQRTVQVIVAGPDTEIWMTDYDYVSVASHRCEVIVAEDAFDNAVRGSEDGISDGAPKIFSSMKSRPTCTNSTPHTEA